LTLTRDDLKDGFCPECFDTAGLKQYEFEELVEEKSGVARYRCENCGVIITSR
jgi:ABC-type ATPase with predicted acetyltransferase domain